MITRTGEALDTFAGVADERALRKRRAGDLVGAVREHENARRARRAAQNARARARKHL